MWWLIVYLLEVNKMVLIAQEEELINIVTAAKAFITHSMFNAGLASVPPVSYTGHKDE